MKKILGILLAAIVTVAVAGCSGKGKGDSDGADALGQDSQLAQALAAGDVQTASAIADSMSLFVDDFTPEQTVQVLTAFIAVHKDAAAKKQTRRDLETLRKYVDVYDIALSLNPNDTRAIFEKAHRANPEVDFDALAKEFRAKLSQYDSVQGAGATEAPADTAKAAPADSVKSPAPDDLPLELRPAE